MMLTDWADLPMKERRIYLAARRIKPATVDLIAADVGLSQAYVRRVLSTLVTRGYLTSATTYYPMERAA